MEVRVAKSAGFCFGVRRAVEKVYQEAKASGGPVYTYGPIIHNDQVVGELENMGVHVIHSEEELEELKEGTVIIRSHGISRRIQEKIQNQGLTCVDATCPFVKKIHKIVAEESGKGAAIIIAGDESHPEVSGIKGWSQGPVYVVERPENVETLPVKKEDRAVLVAQTTFNYTKFEELVEIFSKKGYDVTVVNTVCNATEERQSEARQIAEQVDAMIVIGGRHSSNTQKLYDICKKTCKNTYFIETLVDLDLKPFQSFRRVGITAGASTPNKIIEEVQKYVRNEF